MLKASQLKTDSQVSNEDIVNLIMNQALVQIITLTGVNKAQALTFMSEQLSPIETVKMQVQQPIIEQEESLFIRQMFN